MRARLVRLQAEIAPDRVVIEALGRGIAAGANRLAAEEAPNLALAAVHIHRYYTAIEGMLQRIERTFGSEPTGGDWHLELLRGAILDLPGVRPPVLPRSAIGPLREVLRFRHFFRHAYAIELDGAKLAVVAAQVAGVRVEVDAAFATFDDFLAKLVDALGEARA